MPKQPASFQKLVLIGPTYPYRGGIAHYTTLLGKALAEKHDLHLISFKRQYPQFLYPGESDKDPSLEPLQLEAEYLLDPLYPWTWWQALRRIRQIDPQAVIITWWTTFWGPAFASLAWALRRRGIPVIYLIHNVYPHEARPWDRWIAGFVLAQGQACLVQSENERKRLAALLPGTQVSLCQHPVYDFLTERRLPKARARQALGLPVEGDLLLFFGIVRPYKGLNYLLQALGKLAEQSDLRPHLVIAGEFWETKEPYLRQIAGLGLEDQVTVLDRYIPDEQVALLFSAADGFVAPYTGGTQSGALKIAASFGLPIILSESLADNLQPGAGRFIIRPQDQATFVQALQAVLAVPPEQVTLTEGEATWQDMVTTIEQMVSDLRNTLQREKTKE